MWGTLNSKSNVLALRPPLKCPGWGWMCSHGRLAWSWSTIQEETERKRTSTSAYLSAAGVAAWFHPTVTTLGL